MAGPCLFDSRLCPSYPTQSLPPKREERPTHPRLINGVVELGFHGDLAVGVGVHQGQAEVGVIATSGEGAAKGRRVTYNTKGEQLVGAPCQAQAAPQMPRCVGMAPCSENPRR